MQAPFGTRQTIVAVQISPLFAFNRFAFAVADLESDFAFVANAFRAKQAFCFPRCGGTRFAYSVDCTKAVIACRACFGVIAGGTVRQNRRTGCAYAVVGKFIRGAGKSFAFRGCCSAVGADKAVGAVFGNIAYDAFSVAVGF